MLLQVLKPLLKTNVLGTDNLCNAITQFGGPAPLTVVGSSSSIYGTVAVREPRATPASQ